MLGRNLRIKLIAEKLGCLLMGSCLDRSGD